MYSDTAIDELYSGDDMHEKRNFVDEVNIPGFLDNSMFYSEDLGDDRLSDRTTAATRTDSSAAGSAVPVPDLDGAVISVFAIAVVLLVVGQMVIVCRQRHRRGCQRRCRKWNVPVFGQLHGLTTANHAGGVPTALRSPPPSDIWTALPPSPLSALFHSDNYRTPAFAYINRRSSDSLPSNAAVASRTASSGSENSSTAAIFVRPGSSVTWSDVGEMTSSSPEKRPTTSLSMTSSDGGGVAVESRWDGQEQASDDQQTRPTADDLPATTTNDREPVDDDVIVTSSASISCSPTHSQRSADSDDEVDEVPDHSDLHRQSSLVINVHRVSARNNPGQTDSFTDDVDHSEPVSPTSVSNSSTDVPYIELTTDCSTAHHDTDNSTC